MNRPFPWRFLLPKLNAAVLLYLGLTPLYLLLGTALMPSQLRATMLLPLSAVVLTYGVGCIHSKWRKPLFALAVVLTASEHALLFLPAHAVQLMTFLSTLLTMLLLMPAMSRPSHMEWTASQISIGIGLYLAGLALAQWDAFTGVKVVMSLFFSVYLVMSVFYFNRLTLLSTADADKAAGLFRYNRRLLTLCCLIAIPIANFDAVKAAVKDAALWLARAAVVVMMFIASLFPTSSLPPGDGAADSASLDMGAEAAEPGTFAQIMEKIAIVVAVILLAALAIIVLYQIGKMLRKLIRKVWKRLQAYSKKIGDDYEDSSETLLVWRDVQNTVKQKWEQYRRRARIVPWDQLTAREAVRRIYALLLLRSKQSDPALTVQETLANGGMGLTPENAMELAALYDEARYSDHAISDERAQAMRKKAGL
ncbi:MAG: hypothetical protein LLF96_02345 [Eubacteriales bacterium]|nr:hypothetical protein [Eubacteriales bacterium]